MLDRPSGAPAPADRDLLGPHAREFSFDASRLPWRLTLDWLWFKDDRARQALQGLSLPRREIAQRGRLLASYHADGSPAAEYEAVSIYGATLGSLLFDDDRDLASRVFAEKIAGRYADGPEGAFWGDPNNYYDQNWAWFATALMHGGMANLWAGQAVVDWAPLWSR